MSRVRESILTNLKCEDQFHDRNVRNMLETYVQWSTETFSVLTRRMETAVFLQMMLMMMWAVFDRTYRTRSTSSHQRMHIYIFFCFSIWYFQLKGKAKGFERRIMLNVGLPRCDFIRCWQVFLFWCFWSVWWLSSLFWIKNERVEGRNWERRKNEMNITNINESFRAIYRTQKNKFQMKTDINNQIFSFSLNRLSKLVIEKKTLFFPLKVIPGCVFYMVGRGLK